MEDEEITSQNTIEELGEEDDYYDDSYSYHDTFDYCCFGFAALIILLIVWRLLFRHGKFKVSKDGIEFETDNTKEEKK